jgi:hypothetical protein
LIADAIDAMPNLAPLVTALILDRPTCLDCIASKGGLSSRRTASVIERIARVLTLHRQIGRCRACGRMDAEVMFVDRPR